jgi:tetratricopeptide (TPR) repeat protein
MRRIYLKNQTRGIFWCFLILSFLGVWGGAFAQTSDTSKVNALNRLAEEYYLQQPAKTQELANEALQLAQKINYPRGIAQAYYNQSLVYKLKANYVEEMRALLTALKIFQQLNEQLSVATIYRSIGVLQNQQIEHNLKPNSFEKAREYFNKAIKIFQKLNNPIGEAKTFKSIGNLYSSHKKYSEGISYYLEALKIQEKLQNQEEIANLYNNLGVAYFEQNQYAPAMEYYQKSLAIILKINNLVRLAAAFYNIGRVYLIKNQTEKAFDAAQKSLEYAQKSQIRQAIREAYWLLTEVYAQKQNYAEAYRYHKAYKQVADSIYSVEIVEKTTQIQALYESEVKEQQLNLLRKEKKITQLWLSGSLGLFVIIVIISGLVIYYQSTNIRKNRRINEQKEALYQVEQTLQTTALENEKLKAIRLAEDLGFRNKELMTFTLSFAQKNNILQEIRQEMQEIAINLDKPAQKRLGRLVNQVDIALKTEDDWEEFKLYFEKTHSGFFEKLKTDFNELSNSELRLCALTRLNMNTKEIADILGISPDSVRMARYRLRKKLNLNTDDNLMDLILKY